MKRVSVLFIVLVFIVGCGVNNLVTNSSSKQGFDITFTNNTKQLRCYRLLWFDHNFDNFYGPAAMCGGELQPGKSNEVKQGYPAGLWAIEWDDCRTGEFMSTRLLDVTENTKLIITTPWEDILK